MGEFMRTIFLVVVSMALISVDYGVASGGLTERQLRTKVYEAGYIPLRSTGFVVVTDNPTYVKDLSYIGRVIDGYQNIEVEGRGRRCSTIPHYEPLLEASRSLPVILSESPGTISLEQGALIGLPFRIKSNKITVTSNYRQSIGIDGVHAISIDFQNKESLVAASRFRGRADNTLLIYEILTSNFVSTSHLDVSVDMSGAQFSGSSDYRIDIAVVLGFKAMQILREQANIEVDLSIGQKLLSDRVYSQDFSNPTSIFIIDGELVNGEERIEDFGPGEHALEAYFTESNQLLYGSFRVTVTMDGAITEDTSRRKVVAMRGSHIPSTTVCRR